MKGATKREISVARPEQEIIDYWTSTKINRDGKEEGDVLKENEEARGRKALIGWLRRGEIRDA